MNYNRESVRPSTSAAQKEIGCTELVYGTINAIQLQQNGQKEIKWKHLSSGTIITHTISKDKLQYDNCYDKLEVGKIYAIQQCLVSHKYGGRWVWTDCVALEVTEARLIMERVGYFDIDWELVGDLMEIIKKKRRLARDVADKHKMLTDLVEW